MSQTPAFDAVVLAGGAGERLGGVSKPDIELAGRRLVDGVLVAVADAREIVVVGDVAVPDGVHRTLEDPPLGGPVAGVAAGLDVLATAGPRADWTVLLACDLAIAAETATFGLPEVKRSLVAGAGGVFRLPRALPRAIALQMIATGEPFPAARAAGFGLVNEVVPAAEVEAEAEAEADDGLIWRAGWEEKARAAAFEHMCGMQGVKRVASRVV